MYQIIFNALRETLYMVVSASLLSILIAIPFGMLLASIADNNNRLVQSVFYFFYSILQVTVNIPYLMLMLLFIPATNWLINNSVTYTSATIIPLTVAGTLFLTNKVFRLMSSLIAKWQATSKAMGANKKQLFLFILIPEGLATLIAESANTCALMVGCSIIAGALGAGGLGQLAIEKSIHDPNPTCVILSILILVALQQLFKYTGTLVVQQMQPR